MTDQIKAILGKTQYQGVGLTHVSPYAGSCPATSLTDTAAELAILSGYGISHIRVIIDDYQPHGIYAQQPYFRPEDLVSIVEFLDDLEAAGTGITLCFACKARYQEGTGVCAPAAANSYYPYTEAMLRGQWQSLLPVIQGHNAIDALEIGNEPNVGGYFHSDNFGTADAAADAWLVFQNEIIELIRNGDSSLGITSQPNMPIVVNSGGGAFQFKAPIPYEDLLYSHHAYHPYGYTLQAYSGVYPPTLIDTLAFDEPTRTWDDAGNLAHYHAHYKLVDNTESPYSVISFQELFNVDIYIGEWGAQTTNTSTELFVKDRITLYQSLGWSWMYFTYFPSNSLSTNFLELDAAAQTAIEPLFEKAESTYRDRT